MGKRWHSAILAKFACGIWRQIGLSEISIPDISLSYRNDNHTFKPKISALVFAPDSKTIVSGTMGGKVQMWDAKTGVPLTLLFTGEEPVLSGKPDNTHIALSGRYSNTGILAKW